MARVARADVKKQLKTLAKINRSIKNADLDLDTVRVHTIQAEDKLRTVLKDVEIAQDNLVDTHKQQQSTDELLEQVKIQISEGELTVSGLSVEEQRLLGSISDKKVTLEEFEQQELASQAYCNSAVATRESQVKQLEDKLLLLTTEIDQKVEDERLMRTSLAEWQKRLESQDQNLRIREAKVAEGETKIVRNSSLLNL